MVTRRPLLPAMLAMLALTAEASAQEADWSHAGGGLFAGPAAGPAEEGPVATGPAVVGPAPQPLAGAVDAAAARHGLDPKLLHALVAVESGYRAEVCSRAGACGLTQLMPATAAELGVRDRLSPEDSLGGGAEYLARQIRRFGDLRLALAAYNAGPERVARLGRIPAIAETRAYVDAVVECYLALAAGRRIRSARDCDAGERPR